ncbi:MAG: hypothetical protein BWY15_01373 [Firmicutes bacterium ADurb.Bin193]|nr:MAG: hypothetical protein BWY15_01373 [Firmicutes bacterium ADurb.Bin193]
MRICASAAHLFWNKKEIIGQTLDKLINYDIINASVYYTLRVEFIAPPKFSSQKALGNGDVQLYHNSLRFYGIIIADDRLNRMNG